MLYTDNKHTNIYKLYILYVCHIYYIYVIYVQYFRVHVVLWMILCNIILFSLGALIPSPTSLKMVLIVLFSSACKVFRFVYLLLVYLFSILPGNMPGYHCCSFIVKRQALNIDHPIPCHSSSLRWTQPNPVQRLSLDFVPVANGLCNLGLLFLPSHL